MAMDIIARGLALRMPNLDSALAVRGTFYVAGAKPGVDAYPLIMSQVAAAKAAGGGTVFLPHIGGAGYTLSDTIVVDSDDITIVLDDNVTLTKTSVTAFVGPDAGAATGVNGTSLCAFLFSGKLTGPAPGRYYIKRPQLIGLRQVTINGNGSNAVGYTYSVGYSGQHNVVTFMGCEQPLAYNLIFKNGLTGGCNMGYSPGGLMDRCGADGTVYDNGLNFMNSREHQIAVSDTDPNTWCNGTIRDCWAKNCANHGIGSFGAVGVTIINPLVVDCGNNIGPSYQGPGPAGGINTEHDSINVLRDYHVTIINPRVYNSYGFAMRTNCKGTRVIGGELKNARTPTNYTDTAAPIWGTAIFVQQAGELTLDNVTIDTAGNQGIRMSGSGGQYPSLYINGGLIKGCDKKAIYAIGYSRLVISPETMFSDNGNVSDTGAGNQYTIELNNAPANTDAGYAQIAGTFLNCQGGVLRTSRPGYLDISKGITAENILSASSSAYFAIHCQDLVVTLKMANIFVSNANAKIARVAQVSSITNVYIDRASIPRHQTSTKAAVEFTTTPTNYYGSVPETADFPAWASTFTPNHSNGIVNLTLTGNTTIANNVGTIPEQQGQTMSFKFTQDGTGGRTISWQSGYKGATLSGSGTAGQKAVVRFRHTGTEWVQEFSSGWFS